RITASAHPWTADHAVGGTVILPGTAFVDLAAHAGLNAGTPHLADLTLEAPLVIRPGQAPALQAVLDPAEPDGTRGIAVYSRPSPDSPWTRHATGQLAAEPAARPFPDLTTWPPAGTTPLDTTSLYDQLTDAGLQYGPVFQGVTAAWNHPDGSVYADINLPEGTDTTGHLIHPALLDAALHPAAGLSPVSGNGDGNQPRLPFAWAGITIHAAGATTLRAKLTATGDGTITLHASDSDGQPVTTVTSLALRVLPPGALTAPAAGSGDDSLYQLLWAQTVVPARADETSPLPVYPGLAALATATGPDAPPPVVVIAPGPGPDQPMPTRVHTAAQSARQLLQDWLADDRFTTSRLVVLTRNAVSTGAERPGPAGATDLAAAAIWGLAASAQSENPGRITLIDTDADPATDPGTATALAAVINADHPRAAVRSGTTYLPRLTRAAAQPTLAAPTGTAWQLQGAASGALDALAMAPSPASTAPPGPGQVQIAVRAAGLNFRDVLVALGMFPDGAPHGNVLGSESAGIVTAVGEGVTGLAPGDRVMALTMVGGIAPLALADARLVVPVPPGWSDAEAASAPVAFMTAYYGLVDLGHLQAGQTLLVHAATGGVGMAALQLARHWGIEAYGTASPPKQHLLRELGLPADHIASTRDGGFEAAFRTATAGRGVDAVLNALAGELTTASLRLLAPGGTFLEMGKTDKRDPAEVEAAYPGTSYHAFDLGDPGPDRLGEILTDLAAQFTAGTLQPLLTAAFDVRLAPDAFRVMSQARHTGKIALTIPPAVRYPVPATDPALTGTVLVTGGTGTLGTLTAKHIASQGVTALLLASRRGPAAPGAASLAASLARAGAAVTVTACDTADPIAVDGLLSAIPGDIPLTAVYHTAGTLADATIPALTPAHVDEVLRPKADAAWNLHRATAGMPSVQRFVLFSSVAGLLGAPGQGNYAAANTVLDALAAHRHAHGLPATSLAWGYWAQASGMTGHLTAADQARIGRGMAPLEAEHALVLMDTAVVSPRPQLVPCTFNLSALREAAAAGTLHPILATLVPAAPRRAAAAETVTVASQLATLAPGERRRRLLDLIRTQATAVLARPDTDGIDPATSFKDLGFDSLTAVEFRNRLSAAAGLRLPATLTFDYPSPQALAAYLDTQVTGTAPARAAVTSRAVA
ncbi:MAG: SDR family NAD(P)-dependent oxidoreductase, partial [Streptosporangiaceae bacterium]